MTGWAYGLTEFNGVLTLCEVYHKDGKYLLHLPLNWKDVKKKDVPVILNDLRQQLDSKKFRFKEDFREFIKCKCSKCGKVNNVGFGVIE